MSDLAAKIESALGEHTLYCPERISGWMCRGCDWRIPPSQTAYQQFDAHLARDVIAPLIEAHGRESAAAALKATKSLADDWRKVRCGVTSPGLRRAADELAQAIKADIDEVNRRDYDLNAPWINRAQRSTGAKP